MKLTGAQILVNCLLEQGVDTVFGYPGGQALFIYEALYEYQDKIKHILTCHEQGASHAADGYARSTGRVGVVIATSGPGATNLVTGIATAYMDSVPLVAITGNVSTNLLGRDSFQEVDITGVTVPITKHNYIVKDVNNLATTVREAFKIARSGRPGPVLIDIPKDISATTADYEPCEPLKFIAHSPVSSEEIKTAIELIKSSKRPFIFAGGGIKAADACGELFEFSKKVASPVALSLMGLGSFPPDDELFTGMLGMHGSKASSVAVSECDLFIALGTRFSDRVLCNPKTFANNAKILHIDIDPAEINKNIGVYAAVHGNVKETLSLLCKQLEKQDHSEWLTKIVEVKKKFPSDRPLKNDTMPYKILTTLHDLTNGEAIITTEVGQHQMWTGQYYKFDNPRKLLSSGGLGTMGYGLGAAIGAQVANPDKRVCNIAGDGSFYMNLNEIATTVTYNLPIVEIIMNNGVLGMVRQWQKLFFNQHYSNSILHRNTDIIKLAEAFGAVGLEIREPEDIEPVLKKALACGKPCVINCIIDSEENVLPMVPAGAAIEDPILELS
jgi:acetolactate synthase-1/2/3 large subunit